MNRYIDEYNMLTEDWAVQDNDRLWKTAIYSIINPEHVIHLYACFKNGYAYRHPLDNQKPYNDCSRDQVIMAFTAFDLAGKRLPELKRKFSDKFKQTFDMVWWIKALKGSNFHSWLFLTLWRIILPILFKFNDILWWYVQKMHTPLTDKKNIYWRLRYPMYAFHLLSWMVYCLSDSRAKRKLNWYCIGWLSRNDFSNFLLLALHGCHVSGIVQAQTDFRWQRRLDHIPPGVRLDPYDGDYPIDVDILKAI